MKRLSKYLIAMSSILVLTSCNKGGNTQEADNSLFVITNNISQVEQGDVFSITTNYDGSLTYSSSDSSIASISSDGIVTAKKEGIALITVSNSKHSETLSFSVVSDYVPELEIDINDLLRLSINQIYELSPIINYKGQKVETTDISYLSSNSNVVSVDENGVLSAKTVGNAKITVSSNYRYFDISEDIDVVVNNVKYIYFGKDIYNIYMLNEGEYKNSADISATLVDNGQVVKNAAINYEIADPSIVSINDGVITALKSGETTITASSNEISTTCIVKVNKPVFKTGLSFDYEIGKDFDIPTYEISDFNKNNIKHIYYDEIDVSKEGILDKDKIVGSPNAKTLLFETNNAMYEADVTIYNAILKTKEDCKDVYKRLWRKFANENNKDEGYYYDGYVVIDEDIDFGGEAYTGILNPYDCKYEQMEGTFYPNGYNNGFIGIVDGRNHKISNIRFETLYSSFIGSLIKTGVAKNFTIENAVVAGISCAAVVASTNNAITLENIKVTGYLDIDDVVFENAYKSSGLFIATIPSGSIKIKDCYVELLDKYNEKQNAAILGYVYTTYDDATYFENVTVVGPSHVLYGYSPRAGQGESQTYPFVTYSGEREGIHKFYHHYEYEISLLIKDGYQKDAALSTEPTCTNSGSYTFKKDGSENKVFSIEPIGHNIVGNHCINDGCGLQVLDKVHKEADLKGFNFNTLSDATLVSISNEYGVVDLTNGVLPFAKADVGTTTETYYAEFSDSTIIPVDIKVYSLLIYTEEDLRNCNKYLTLVDTPCKTTGEFKLMNDITMTSKWGDKDSIGLVLKANGFEADADFKWHYDSNRAFEGTFDGCGHTIDNFIINRESNSPECCGLFYSLSQNGVVKNLTLKGSTNSGQNFTKGGLLFAKAYAGTIENITVEVQFTSEYSDKGHAGGALLGQLTDSAYNGQIYVNNCTIIAHDQFSGTQERHNPLGVNSDDYFFDNPQTCPNAKIHLTNVNFVGFSTIYYDGKTQTSYTNVANLPSYIICDNVNILPKE